MGPFDLQFAKLVARFEQAVAQDVPGVGKVVTIPRVPLPAGWNKGETSVHFIAPEGYPFARPDCFWADEDLRLGSGAAPQASSTPNLIPGIGRSGLWFSWHLQEWNANRDDLLSWFAVIKNRFLKAS
jgi:hypothetical protein